MGENEPPHVDLDECERAATIRRAKEEAIEAVVQANRHHLEAHFDDDTLDRSILSMVISGPGRGCEEGRRLWVNLKTAHAKWTLARGEG